MHKRIMSWDSKLLQYKHTTTHVDNETLRTTHAYTSTNRTGASACIAHIRKVPIDIENDFIHHGKALYHFPNVHLVITIRVLDWS